MDILHFTYLQLEKLVIVSASTSLERYDWGDQNQWRLLKDEWAHVVAESHGPIVLDFRDLRLNSPNLAMIAEFARMLTSCHRRMAFVCTQEDIQILEIHPGLKTQFLWWDDLDQAINTLTETVDD